MIKELGKVAPYGVYVLNDNTGFVNLSKSSDTSEFAVESIRAWWLQYGRVNFPNAKKLFITCDGGRSNGCRVRLWKELLAVFAEETGLEVMVCHFPPGTSKWNKIEHRLFCYTSRNREGKPLIDIQTMVNFISNTTTKNGLTVPVSTKKGKRYPMRPWLLLTWSLSENLANGITRSGGRLLPTPNYCVTAP